MKYKSGEKKEFCFAYQDRMVYAFDYESGKLWVQDKAHIKALGTITAMLLLQTETLVLPGGEKESGTYHLFDELLKLLPDDLVKHLSEARVRIMASIHKENQKRKIEAQ